MCGFWSSSHELYSREEREKRGEPRNAATAKDVVVIDIHVFDIYGESGTAREEILRVFRVLRGYKD
jgi:hypothetical protein